MSSSEANPPPHHSPPPVDLNRGIPIFIPIFLGFTTLVPPPSQGGETQPLSQGLVFINPFTSSAIVIPAAGIPDQLDKPGPLPASKKSVEAMPAVKITEELGSVESCAICLGEYEIGGELKEMPCKHRYHSGCIVKWLGIHGSCPVCRHEMPVEEGGNIGRRVEGEIRISFFFETSDSGFGNESGRSSDGGSADESSTRDMEID